MEDGYIQGIFVEEAMRSLGIGKALIDVCKGKYKDLSLHVYCKNQKALDFYLREGFQVRGKQLDKNTGQWECEMTWSKVGK